MRIGILGATGMVGREIIKVLGDRNFKIDSLRLFASARSEGKIMETKYGNITIENADNINYGEFDMAFFAIGGDHSLANAKKANDSGCIVIDSSSAFRYETDVPLVVPEVNAEDIGDAMLISKPNCTTAIAAIPLFELHKKYGLKKVIISSYQATSGAGQGGMKELIEQSKNYLEEKEVINNAFVHPIPFNIIPHIDKFQDNDYTKEEMKIVWETRKMFKMPELAISCTCVRIPTIRAHAESIVVETEKIINPKDVKTLFSNTKGIELVDDIANNKYPMPLTASKKYDVEVGRIRQNLVFGEKGLEFFVCGDQILKGAALNAVQIAEVIKEKRFGE